MKLLLVRPREPFMRRADYSLGFLYVDDTPFSFTLEDTVRANGEKIQNKTAIPFGTYKVVLSFSPHLKVVCPELLNVPRFSGIRIHPGNSETDTSGCILVGDSISISGSRPLQMSTIAFNRLMDILSREARLGREIVIEIRESHE